MPSDPFNTASSSEAPVQKTLSPEECAELTRKIRAEQKINNHTPQAFLDITRCLRSPSG